MHDSRPAEASRSGWSRWAVVTLLGVLVVVASGAAVMASRSMARAPQMVAAEDSVKVAAASGAAKTSPASVQGLDTVKGSGAGSAAPPPAGALAAVHAQPGADPAEVEAPSDEGENIARRSTARGERRARRPVLRRSAAAPRRARVRAASAAEQPKEEAAEEQSAEPDTVDVLDLPEAKEEPEPVAAAPKSSAGEADGDLVIEEGAPKMAFLSVDASPYATVFIDGEKVGVTPLVRLELAPGLHRMVARTEDGRTKRFTLQLDPGKTEAVRVAWEE